MCPIKQVKHYFLTWARVAEWVESNMDILTACVRVSPYAASKSYVFFSVLSLYCIYESFQGKIIHDENDWIFIIVIKFTIIGADIADGRQWLSTNLQRIIANDYLAFILGRPPATSTLIPRLTE